MGRPRIEIDWEQVEELASIGCTQEEIAAVMKCCVDTLTGRKRFSEVYKIGRDRGKQSLRRTQWETAMSGGKGAYVMQIWLGKQMLGQRDRHELSGDDAQPFKLVIQEAAKPKASDES